MVGGVGDEAEALKGYGTEKVNVMGVEDYWRCSLPVLDSKSGFSQVIGFAGCHLPG